MINIVILIEKALLSFAAIFMITFHRILEQLLVKNSKDDFQLNGSPFYWMQNHDKVLHHKLRHAIFHKRKFTETLMIISRKWFLGRCFPFWSEIELLVARIKCVLLSSCVPATNCSRICIIQKERLVLPFQLLTVSQVSNTCGLCFMYLVTSN